MGVVAQEPDEQQAQEGEYQSIGSLGALSHVCQMSRECGVMLHQIQDMQGIGLIEL